MPEPTLITIIVACAVAFLMVVAAIAYYYANRDKLDG